MEVHHHSKPHEKRNWVSYLGEFFMLFLAVFCGFIAENLREGYVEKERAHEYIASMVSDLKKDTLHIQECLIRNNETIQGIDSLLFYLRSHEPESAKKIYINSRFVGSSSLYENANGTITQLKNAGGLRLIKDTAAVNAITAYDQFNESIKKQGDAYYNSMISIMDVMEQVLDFSIAFEADNTIFYVTPVPEKRLLYYNKCFIHRQIIKAYCTNLSVQKRRAAKTIALLNKNYHLD